MQSPFLSNTTQKFHSLGRIGMGSFPTKLVENSLPSGWLGGNFSFLLRLGMGYGVILLLFLTISVHSQTQPKTLPSKHQWSVYHFEYYVSSSNYDYSEVAHTIVGDATDDYERMRRIYLWVCNNVSYDNSGKIRTADRAWDTHTAVCQGYCELIYRLAKAVDIKIELVNGQSKPFNGSNNLEEHVWLSAKIGEQSILMDPTWGAGTTVNGKFHHSQNPLLWFDVDPLWLIFTHYPEYSKYQFLVPEVSKSKFIDVLPFCTPALDGIGVSPIEAFEKSIHGMADYPKVNPEGIRFLQFTQVPQTRTLKVGETYNFSATKLEDCELSLRCGNQEYDESKWTVTSEISLLQGQDIMPQGQETIGVLTQYQTETPNYRISITPSKPCKLKVLVKHTTRYFSVSQPVLEYEVVE